MAITNSLLTTGSAANVYVSSGSSAITAMYLCNIDTVPRTVDIYVCPSGNTLTTASTRIYSAVNLQTGDTYVVDSVNGLLKEFPFNDNVTIKEKLPLSEQQELIASNPNISSFKLFKKEEKSTKTTIPFPCR